VATVGRASVGFSRVGIMKEPGLDALKRTEEFRWFFFFFNCESEEFTRYATAAEGVRTP
jgi:hypothetical protein